MQQTEIPQTHKRQWCHAINMEKGYVCSLYLDHHGKHKSQHLKAEWSDEGEE